MLCLSPSWAFAPGYGQDRPAKVGAESRQGKTPLWQQRERFSRLSDQPGQHGWLLRGRLVADMDSSPARFNDLLTDDNRNTLKTIAFGWSSAVLLPVTSLDHSAADEGPTYRLAVGWPPVSWTERWHKESVDRAHVRLDVMAIIHTAVLSSFVLWGLAHLRLQAARVVVPFLVFQVTVWLTGASLVGPWRQGLLDMAGVQVVGGLTAALGVASLAACLQFQGVCASRGQSDPPPTGHASMVIALTLLMALASTAEAIGWTPPLNAQTGMWPADVLLWSGSAHEFALTSPALMLSWVWAPWYGPWPSWVWLAASTEWVTPSHAHIPLLAGGLAAMYMMWQFLWLAHRSPSPDDRQSDVLQQRPPKGAPPSAWARSWAPTPRPAQRSSVADPADQLLPFTGSPDRQVVFQPARRAAGGRAPGLPPPAEHRDVTVLVKAACLDFIAAGRMTLELPPGKGPGEIPGMDPYLLLVLLREMVMEVLRHGPEQLPAHMVLRRLKLGSSQTETTAVWALEVVSSTLNDEARTRPMQQADAILASPSHGPAAQARLQKMKSLALMLGLQLRHQLDAQGLRLTLDL
jgi:hypothetical protein